MSGHYEIRVRHRLGPPVTDIFRDLELRYGDDSTLLRIDGTDQAMLHGTLIRLGDLGLEIISVERIETVR